MLHKNAAILASDDYKKMNAEKRREWAKNSKAAHTCLQFHKIGDCKSKHVCKKCEKSQSTLLHLDDIKKTQSHNNSKTVMCATVSNEANNESAEIMPISANVAAGGSGALLATALITVETGHGELLILKALIDQGSQGAFIRESAAQLLKLTTKKVSV